jgi:hypothetical protein
MSRITVRCSMGHTALFPGKNDVRSEMIHQVSQKKDIITVSHGALDVLNILRHQGRIMIVDTDTGVIESSHYIRVGDPMNKKASDYPRLNFLPEYQGDIADGLRWYAERFGLRNLGAIDLDLTGTVDQVWQVARRVLAVLKEYPWGKMVTVFLTYRDGRDSHGRNAAQNRVASLVTRLNAKCTWHRCYRSDWIGRFATRERGSSMAIVGLKAA